MTASSSVQGDSMPAQVLVRSLGKIFVLSSFLVLSVRLVLSKFVAVARLSQTMS